MPGHTQEIADALNTELSKKWAELRGVEIASFGVTSVSASEEDENMIKELQRNAAFKDPTMAAAHLTGAQAQAMQNAAKNEGAGAFMGFAGLNMAQTAGANTQNLYEMGQQQKQAETLKQSSASWACMCGKQNTGNFCVECGKSKPSANGWSCAVSYTHLFYQ